MPETDSQGARLCRSRTVAQGGGCRAEGGALGLIDQ